MCHLIVAAVASGRRRKRIVCFSFFWFCFPAILITAMVRKVGQRSPERTTHMTHLTAHPSLFQGPLDMQRLAQGYPRSISETLVANLRNADLRRHLFPVIGRRPHRSQQMNLFKGMHLLS